jgi:hypothetical protein
MKRQMPTLGKHQPKKRIVRAKESETGEPG